MIPVTPRPASSVVLIRSAGHPSAEPLQVYMIRRNSKMRFLGGYYAFPGGKVDAADAAPESLARAKGTSEGFWIGPREAYGRFRAGVMAMAEPAEYALGYLSQFDSDAAVWANHADGQDKFHGIVHRIEFYGRGYDWATATWKTSRHGSPERNPLRRLPDHGDSH